MVDTIFRFLIIQFPQLYIFNYWSSSPQLLQCLGLLPLPKYLLHFGHLQLNLVNTTIPITIANATISNLVIYNNITVNAATIVVRICSFFLFLKISLKSVKMISPLYNIYIISWIGIKSLTESLN